MQLRLLGAYPFGAVVRAAVTPMPLTLTDGNKRKSTRAKPLSKEKENIAQRQEGLGTDEDKDIILGNSLAGALNKYAEMGIKVSRFGLDAIS